MIPVFALGRAQELLILIESYWERMNDLAGIPLYFSAGLTERANDYYKLFISWTNEKVKKTFTDRNMFDFRMIKQWKPEYAEEPGPMVLFASPGYDIVQDGLPNTLLFFLLGCFTQALLCQSLLNGVMIQKTQSSCQDIVSQERLVQRQAYLNRIG